jgi:hypothetical protein
VTSIERTAYPRFKRLLSARELHVFFTPQPDEVAWARGFAGSDEHLLAMVVMLKCFSRLGYFPALGEVPAVVVDHVRRDLELPEGVAAVYAAGRTSRRHRDAIGRRRACCGIRLGRGRLPRRRSGRPRMLVTIHRI